ncbi:MAG: polyphosphate kinase 1 [Fusobacteriota bacterium]
MNLNDPMYFLNKQLSWVEFNKRVLEEAQDENTPLLERLKFISIVSSNFDEFMMVRVSRVRRAVLDGIDKTDKSGLRPEKLYELLSKKIHKLVNDQYDTYNKIISQLENEGIKLIKYVNLSKKEEIYIKDYFKDIIKPCLTPMAIDESRPFPLLLNKSLNIGISLESEESENFLKNKTGDHLFSIIRVPSNIKRFIKLKDKNRYVFLEEVIINNLNNIFPGYSIKSTNLFRMTRNADVNLNEDTQNLLKEMESYVKRRRWGEPVRLEINSDMDKYFKKFLIKSLDLKPKDIYVLDGPIDLIPVLELTKVDGYGPLKYAPRVAKPAVDFVTSEDIFKTVREKDCLVHHPFESFDPVVKIIKKASEDPKVLAIKQTLYRVSGDSPIIKALAKASNNGKQVTVLVELKARFDEKNNIGWAKKLESAGCHVIYGLTGLKVHSKLLLIIREEKDGIRRYVHMATGNYNDTTAKFYTDIGMFTAKETFGKDVSSLFNILTGYSSPPVWKKIIVAPMNFRKKFLNLINKEIENSISGIPGRIIIKCNSLIDKKLIKKLYEASKAGVKIDLIIRGICCLRPNIKEVSENIRVISIVGQLLEHSRIFYFYNSGNPLIYGSSADWRPRNLDRRVEVAFPIEDEDLKEKIFSILKLLLHDNIKARELKSDGTYQRVKNSLKPINSQDKLYKKIDCYLQKKEKQSPNINIKRLFKIFSK